MNWQIVLALAGIGCIAAALALWIRHEARPVTFTPPIEGPAEVHDLGTTEWFGPEPSEWEKKFKAATPEQREVMLADALKESAT